MATATPNAAKMKPEATSIVLFATSADTTSSAGTYARSRNGLESSPPIFVGRVLLSTAPDTFTQNIRKKDGSSTLGRTARI